MMFYSVADRASLFTLKKHPPHIIIAVVYIFISLYVYIFPVPRIVATALNIWENNDIFRF